MTTFYIHIQKSDIKQSWLKYLVTNKLSDIRYNGTEGIIKLPEHIKKKSDLSSNALQILKRYWTEGKILNHSQAKALRQSWDAGTD